MLAGLEGALDRFGRDADAADQFDENVDAL